MKKILKAAMAAGAALLGTSALTGAASAEVEISGNVALTSDYVFRGYTQTDGGPALQGGLDLASGIFYAGTWASNVNFEDGVTGENVANMELDVYAGVTPEVGPFALDFGVVGYFYPGADDDGGEFDYWEGYAKATVSVAENVELGGTFFYSPEFFGEIGDAYYYEVNGSVPLGPVSLSGALGYQDYGDDAIDAYTTWNLGGGFDALGLGFDLRYHDTDVDSPLSDERFVFTVSKSM